MIPAFSTQLATRAAFASLLVLGATASLADAASLSLPAFAARDAIGVSAADRGIAAFPAAHRGGYRDLGRYAATAPVKLGIMLRYQHEPELVQLTMEQGDRRSPYYHRYLSNAQWNAYFAPSPASVARIAYELGRRGLHVTRVLPNRTMIDATGSSAVVERMFSTELHRVYQPGGHGLAYANVTAARLPAFMSGTVVSVAGLHSTDAAFLPSSVTRAASIVRARERAGLIRALDAMRTQARVAAATPRPITTSTPGPNPNPEPSLPASATTVHGTMAGYGPVAFAVSYDEPDMHGYDGKGQNQGNVISGDFADSDLAAHGTEFGYKHTGTTTRVPVDTYFVPSSSTAADVGESTLDVEAMLGLAYGANYYEYLVNTLADLSIEDGYNRVVSDNIVGDVNSSFGGCEDDDPSFGFATNYIAMQGAAKGITFHASTGDTGGNGCEGVANGAPGAIKGVSFPSADYYFTAVGGTDLVTNPTTGARLSEVGWETSNGGYSNYNALPSWQAAAVNAATVPETAGRNTPDVAFDASLETGYETIQGGSDGLTGGTSLASPIFGATQTMINEIQGSRNGWVNPRLYAILAAQQYTFAFTDVIGNQNEDYLCTAGYDDVTGIGTINGWELAGTE